VTIPADATAYLETASRACQTRKASAGPQFTCQVFGDEWDGFVTTWAPVVYQFVLQALGPYGKEPGAVIQTMPEGFHAQGANASYAPWDGTVSLCASVMRGRPGTILEKLTHEMTHASLDGFPEGDPFYEEGFVDYSVWCFAHAPVWGQYGKAMIEAADFNIGQRRERALRDTSDYDRKRWAGGLYAALAHGPYLPARLALRKQAGELVW
jgi:hypothetical protein